MAANSTDANDADTGPAAPPDATQAEGPLMVRRGGWNMAAKWFLLAMLFIGLIVVLIWLGEIGF